MFFVGCSSIYMMVVLSLQRYYIISKPLNIRKINLKSTLIIIAVCCILGLIWSLMPLTGWTYYTLEGAYTSCGLEFELQTFNIISFNISLFTFVFALPLIIIAITNISLYIKVGYFYSCLTMFQIRLKTIIKFPGDQHAKVYTKKRAGV